MRYRNLLLSVLSGLVLWLAWPPLPFFVLVFVGLVPLLFIERNITNNQKPLRTLFGYTYLTFFIWNAATTWWIWIASPIGAITAIVANSFLMSIPVLLFRSTKKRCGEHIGYVSLPIYWITFEYLHHQWELAWPWLTLGNGFAMYPQLVQWYEFTGALGGSLWIWVLNILIFQLIKSRLMSTLSLGAITRRVAVLGSTLIVPAGLSLAVFLTYTELGKKAEVVIVQPNYNPYTEKFTIEPMIQIREMLRLSTQETTPVTRFWVWPETAIPWGDSRVSGLNVDSLEQETAIKAIRNVLDRHPNITLITGIDGHEIQSSGSKSITARPTSNADVWIDHFNTAILLDSTHTPQHYHKSKLVPAVERMPYPEVFKFLERFALDLGGMSGSLGMQDERTVFFTSDSIGIAPVICFESAFGGYVGEYVRHGADAIFVITNDGWWGTTAGHKQHLYFSSLRAVETRRYVARSANTGISCFVDQRGLIHQRTIYGEQAAIRGNILLNAELTFYSRHGDIMGRAFVWLSALLVVYTIVQRIRKRRSPLDLEQPVA